MNPRSNDIGAYIAPRHSVSPQSSAATATINGSSVDRDSFNSCVVVASAGAATGSPTGVSVAFKLQHSDTGSGDWTDFATGGALSAINTTARLDVDLRMAKRYVRVVTTAALTGGSSPTILVGAAVILGGAVNLPAA